MDTVNSNRRNSYPCEALELRERELHRCRALHKANITVDDIAKEILKYKDQMNDKDLKKVKSEPIDVFQPSNVSAVSNLNKPSSKSFHSVCSSLVQVHHVDAKHLVHCDSIASSLTAIAEWTRAFMFYSVCTTKLLNLFVFVISIYEKKFKKVEKINTICFL